MRWPRVARDLGWAPLRRHHPGRRRLAAAGLAAGSLAAALHVLAPRPAAGAPVVVAARDVPAGAVLTLTDLRVVRRPAEQLPGGTVADLSVAVGRTVGSGMRSGEPLTDARLVGPGLLAGRPEGDVAAPVRIADGEAAALLRPGDRVDVLQAAGDEPGAERSRDDAGVPRARTVVRGATVLARPGGGQGDGGLLPEADPSSGGLLLLAVPEHAAAALAEAAALGPLSVVLR
jgi:pilus assembly protein CpaB